MSHFFNANMIVGGEMALHNPTHVLSYKPIKVLFYIAYVTKV
jgi:hypothetical protein